MLGWEWLSSRVLASHCLRLQLLSSAQKKKPPRSARGCCECSPTHVLDSPALLGLYLEAGPH